MTQARITRGEDDRSQLGEGTDPPDERPEHDDVDATDVRPLEELELERAAGEGMIAPPPDDSPARHDLEPDSDSGGEDRS